MTVRSFFQRCGHAIAHLLERTFFADSARRQHDQLALQMLAPLINAYLPWNGSAMRPGGVRLCLNEIVIHDRRVALELGTGLSTVLLARVLAGRGGQLITVDHDSAWQRVVLGLCGDSASAVSCIHASLKSVECEGTSYQWYDLDAIIAGLGGQRVDLLIVDGPISYPGQLSRYPALPLLRPLLADDAAVILDDIDRADENRIANKWSASTHRPMPLYRLSGGIGLLQLSDRRRYNIF